MKVVQEVKLSPVEVSHQEIILMDQNQNKERVANELTILPKEAMELITEACSYSSYFPNPITQDFMEKYILSKLEFPTLGSKLAQSLTELNGRIDNLFTDAYSYEKSKIEAEALEIDIELLGAERCELENDESISALVKKAKLAKIDNQIKMKTLDKNNKTVSLNRVKLAALNRYNEAEGWKGCVEKYMKEMGVTSLDQVDFKRIRMDEMDAKISKWGELSAANQLEMTPSKFNAIQDNIEAFARGHEQGTQRLQLIHQIQENQKQAQELEVRKQRMLAEVNGASVKPVEVAPAQVQQQ